MKHIIFITESKSKFNEITNYIKKKETDIVLIMYKPVVELFEIQSLNRNDIIQHKLIDAYADNKNYIDHYKASNPEIDVYIMVEDTSLCIDKLCGFPGTFIKFYLQCLSLENIVKSNWGSNSQSIVTLGLGKITTNGEIFGREFEGMVEGNIVRPQGENGFGFDPIFHPVDANSTNAEMTMDMKEKFNPRIMAFQKVLDYLG